MSAETELKPLDAQPVRAVTFETLPGVELRLPDAAELTNPSQLIDIVLEMARQLALGGWQRAEELGVQLSLITPVITPVAVAQAETAQPASE